LHYWKKREENCLESHWALLFGVTQGKEGAPENCLLQGI